MLPLVILLFVILLATGLVRGDFEWWIVLGFLAAAAASIGALFAFQWPIIWSVAIFAALDVALVFWIFKGDVNIS